jgi:type II secretory pathway predicted ATPase ExeA/cell division protein FtsN
MYEQFFGLSENPFSLTPDPRFIYPSRSHDEALAHLRYWVEHREGFAMITGEVGTGKTTSLFRLIEGMDRHFEIAFLTNSTLSPVELLEEICRKFRIDVEKDLTKPALLSKLENYLTRLHEMGHGAVLIIDEAQNFDHMLLEEVRLLSNVTRPGGSPLLQIALVGQPELERKLTQPELRQLKQRIGVHYRIDPLSEEETGEYVHHRVGVAGGYPKVLFPPPTLAALFQKTHGLPREINQLASQALLHAYVEESTSVRPEHVLSAVEEMGFKSVLERGVTLTVTAPGRPAVPIAPVPAAPPQEKIAAIATDPKLRRPETAAEPAPPVREERGPATRTTVRLPAETPPHRPLRRSQFGAIPPLNATSSNQPGNPLVRRLALTAAALVILATAAFLLFGTPRQQDELTGAQSEATMPKAPGARTPPDAAAGGGPNGSSDGTGAESGTTVRTGTAEEPAPATGSAGTESGAAAPGTTPLATAPGTTPPVTAPRDSVEHKTPAQALAGASMETVVMPAWHLQVASLRDSATADQLGRRLAALGRVSFHVDKAPGNEFPWFAVYLGPYGTRAEAESAKVELSALDRHLAEAIVRPPTTR